jgi:hypothetical protein
MLLTLVIIQKLSISTITSVLLDCQKKLVNKRYTGEQILHKAYKIKQKRIISNGILKIFVFS